MVKLMTGLQTQTIDVAGQQARAVRGGKSGAPVALFLHGGIPGVTPFCAGAHIWGDSLEPFLSRLDVLVPDLPGSGGTVQSTEPLTIDTLGRHVIALLAASSIETVDVVGHDVGGLIGVWLALNHPARVRALSIVASPMTAPTGDALDDLLSPRRRSRFGAANPRHGRWSAYPTAMPTSTAACSMRAWPRARARRIARRPTI